MLNRTTNSPFLARRAIIAALLAGWLAIDVASAQEAKKSAPPVSAAKEADERPLIEAYSLQHANAAQIIPMLQGCFPASEECKLTADEARNMLLVWGSRQVHELVGQVLESIDQPSQDDTNIKIFQLVYSKADEMATVLGALTDAEEIRISADTRTNRLIVSSTEEKLKIVEAIVLKLDEANRERDEPRFAPSTTFYIRFVWLASGPDSSDGDDPAEDLKDVLAELAKLGIDDVRQIAQTIVNVGMDGKFAVACQPVYGERPARWTIDGNLEEADEALKLRIQLSTSHGPHIVGTDGPVSIHQPEEDLVDLETDLVMREGHYVVLGITPTGKTQSIFVLQVTPRM